jgi:CheY-like chemotaxis protein
METHRYSILIVEDESIVAEDLRLLLARFGYGITAVCSTGEDAIEKATTNPPDIILMDINLMGEMDGIETAERIQSMMDVPIVFLTAYADDATLERARVAARYGYIMKPFESREIHLSVEVSLHKHAAERKTPDTAPDMPSVLIVDQCRELRELIRQKDRLFGILSEDTANPPNMLLHYCEWILNTAGTAPALRDTAARAPEPDADTARETEEPLDKYISLPTERLQLADQIDVTTFWFKTRLQAKHVELRQAPVDFAIMANPKLLQFILRHTVLAAIDNTPPMMAIDIEAHHQATMAEVAILFPVPGNGPFEDAPPVPPLAADVERALSRNPSLERCEQIVRLQGGTLSVSRASDTLIRIAFTVPFAL